MTNEQIETEIRHLTTKEELAGLSTEIHKEFGNFKVEIQKTFGDFRAEMQKAFGDFKTDLIKTLWLTQLSTIGIILIGVGLLLHFHV